MLAVKFADFFPANNISQWPKPERCNRHLEVGGGGQSLPSTELEYALRIAGEKCGRGGLPEIEIVKPSDAFTCRPERVVRTEQNAVTCVSAHIFDQLARIAADLIG